MDKFAFAFGRTIAVDDLEYEHNNRCRVNGEPTIIFDIRRPTPNGRIYAGSLHVKCGNSEWIGVDRLRRLIREAQAEAGAHDLQDRAEASL